MTSSTVLVAGGGPAGSMAAALLAQSGCDVEVFERAFFPGTTSVSRSSRPAFPSSSW
jgi:flavin-dependent dehydrogenase